MRTLQRPSVDTVSTLISNCLVNHVFLLTQLLGLNVMAPKPLPKHVDTVIVGNGPSSLILSYILHGNTPYYNPLKPHPDPILHRKLSQSSRLLDLDVEDLTAHFGASRFSYSTQALPVNTLFDTLLRPLADTDPGKYGSCVTWQMNVEKRLEHIVVGNTAQAGGQWADNPVAASWDIGALSYAEMLSLPGYSFEEHYQQMHGGRLVPDFHRPTRQQVADYLAAYPEKVGIDNAIYNQVELGGIRRTCSGFHIASHGITCRNLVLASGIFSCLIPPRPLLEPLKTLPLPSSTNNAPLLVVGSGFTAADIIISTPPDRKIIHIFKWNPGNHPSPLRACHPAAYPEYANIYRRMKLAAKNTLGSGVVSPLRIKKSNPFFDHRNWDAAYEGLPNTYIKEVSVHGRYAVLSLETGDGHMIEREISNMEYVIGRRGSLAYLDENTRLEVLGSGDETTRISGRSLRSKVEKSIEIAPHLFAIGSLTGDSLIRFAYGGCAMAAHGILKSHDLDSDAPVGPPTTNEPVKLNPSLRPAYEKDAHPSYSPTGHHDLDVDRKVRAMSIDHEISKCEVWQKSGWWAGGCSIS